MKKNTSEKTKPVLSKREEELLKSNIELIASNLALHAMNIFIKLFTTRPDYQVLFKNFHDVPLDKLRDNPALQRHSVNILNKLASVVSENMCDYDALYAQFDEIAQHHVERKVNGTHLVTLKEVVLQYLKETLKDVLPAKDLKDTLSAWDKVLKVAHKTFVAANS